MLSVLWEIIVPLIIAFLLGWLGLGWLTWRWRHTEVSMDEWDDITSRSTTAEAQLMQLQRERTDLDSQVRALAAELDECRRAAGGT